MSKTAVSILQEGLMKNGKSSPVYTEISSTIGPQQTEFVISVTWDKHRVKGAATTKKEAKQNAARAMIELLTSLNLPYFSSFTLPTGNKKLEHNLQSSMNLSDSSLSSLSTSSQDIFVNYVGSLMEYCVHNRLSYPCFAIVNTTGKSHNLSFTMSCTIGSVSKEASANTKKAAKQNVAKKILEYLKEINDTDIEKSKVCIEFMNLKLDTPVTTNEKYQAIYKKFATSTRLKSALVSPKDIMVKDFHIELTHICRNSLKTKHHDLMCLYRMGEYCTRNITEIKAIIEDSLKVSVKQINIKSQKYDQCIVGIRVTTSPPLVQIGISKTFEQAEQNALRKLLECIVLFIK